MNKNILLSFAAILLLSANVANATAIDAQASKVTAQTNHSYYGFYSQPDKLTKKQLEHYQKMGLISKRQMIKDELKLATKNIVKPSTEILDGFNATFKAMSLLKKHDLKSAKIALISATSQFDKALKKDPSLKLVPIDMKTSFDDQALTLENIKSIKKNALRMINDNQPQEAVALLSQLKNQITIVTTELPMDLYPIATKKALDALNKDEKAETVLPILAAALDTMVETEVVIPMPVLVAQSALKDAEKLDKSKKEEISKLLSLAQTQLDVARYEGYLSKYDTEYKTLSEEINLLKKKNSVGNVLLRDYDKIKKYFSLLFEKIHHGHKK